MLFEHVEKTDDGDRVTERCRPAAGSKNETALLAKAADDESGWRLVDETADQAAGEPEKAAPPQGATAPKATRRQPDPQAPDTSGS